MKCLDGNQSPIGTPNGQLRNLPDDPSLHVESAGAFGFSLPSRFLEEIEDLHTQSITADLVELDDGTPRLDVQLLKRIPARLVENNAVGR
jgi:hypothetical protein